MQKNRKNIPPIINDGNDLYIGICYADEIFEKKGKKFLVDDDINKEIAIIRYQGRLYCFLNICPHNHKHEIYNAIINNGNLTCPVHGWTFSLETGDNINKNQGIRKLKKFDVEEINNIVYLKNPIFDVPKWKKDDNFE